MGQNNPISWLLGLSDETRNSLGVALALFLTTMATVLKAWQDAKKQPVRQTAGAPETRVADDPTASTNQRFTLMWGRIDELEQRIEAGRVALDTARDERDAAREAAERALEQRDIAVKEMLAAMAQASAFKNKLVPLERRVKELEPLQDEVARLRDEVALLRSQVAQQGNGAA